MSLFGLPSEVIHQFSFHLIAQDPLGLPYPLLTLALTCRAFHLVVSSHSFRAKICRLMFDIGPVTRRLFNPRDSDLADELHRCCNLLNEIRRADLEEGVESITDDTLVSAYLLMLNNDGKNYAQLEHAGLDAYVDKFVSTRLWEGKETNQGWPLDNFNNSAALWLMWMTLTKQKLLAEAPDVRHQMNLLILPYVVLPHRYASASAPPNHFNLPLDSQNPCHQQRLISTVSPETPYPIYRDDSFFDMHYFNTRIPICSPLITIAAKLLFVARKEIFPIRAPPHLPQAPGPGIVGPTQEDFREMNRSPAARLCRVVTWNWVTGSPNRVGGEDGDGCEIEERWEESKVWDTEWWRRLLCMDCSAQRPKYLPGDVFKLGSMRGCWHGKEYLPLGTLFRQFLQQPNVHYPGIPDQQSPGDFTESSIGLSVDAIFLDNVQEHHKICECPQESSNVPESHPYVAPTLSFTRPGVGVASSSSPLPIVPQSGRCGVVPIPAPLVFQSTANEQEAGHNEGEQEMNGPQFSDAVALSFPTPRINVIDNSMSNAWFPGHLDGVSFTRVPNTSPGGVMRDRVICAVNFQAPDRNVWRRPEESECLALGGRRRQEGQGKMNAYVYETYDPEKMSMHRGLEMGHSISGAGANNAFTSTSTSLSNDFTNDPHKCQRCLQREDLIRLERKKAEHRSKMMLDRGLRSYGSSGYDWNQDDEYDDEDMDEGEDEDDDEEMIDVDMDELGIDVDGIIAETTDSDSTISMQTNDDSQFISFGDDNRGEHVDQRIYYDKCRIGVECSGVGDVLLSGETGPRHAVWKQFRMYGRVRPWDGLIGILRSSGSAANGTLSNIFIFGYIVGESNFVGELRLAASDPLSPTWGGAFAMSRRIDGGGGGQA